MSRSVCAREKPCGNAAPGLRPRVYNKCKNSLPEVVPGTRSGRRHRRRHRPVIVVIVVVVVVVAIDAQGGVIISHGAVITPEIYRDRGFRRFIRFHYDVEDEIWGGESVIYQ